MQGGKVKWWNDEKGWGFITPFNAQPGDRDVFVHYSSIEMQGRKTLRDGQEVEFEAQMGPKGMQTTMCRVVQED